MGFGLVGLHMKGVLQANCSLSLGIIWPCEVQSFQIDKASQCQSIIKSRKLKT